MAAVTTPQLEDLLSHFGAIQVFLRQQQSEALAARAYISSRRGTARTERFNRAISSELDNLFFHAHSWADTGIQQAYLGGWRGVYGKDPFDVSPEALGGLAAIREQYRGRLNQIEAYVRKDTRRFLRDMQKKGDEELGRTAATFDKKLGIKAVEQSVEMNGSPAVRRYRMDSYAKMLTKAAQQTAYNNGVVDAAAAKKIEVMEVSDGPECGWTSHHDTDKANGKLVTIEEARANPIAHPNCVRGFIPRPDLKKSDIDKKGNKLSSAKRKAEIAAAVALSGLVASQLFDVVTEIVDPEKALQYATLSRLSNVYHRTFVRLVDRQLTDAPFYLSPPPPPYQQLPIAVGGEGSIFPQASIAEQLSEPISELGWGDTVSQWGDALLDQRIKIPDLPDWLRNSIHALDSDSESAIKDKFMLFSKYIHAKRVTSRAAGEISNVINFELKRRQWNEFTILQNIDKLQSGVSATFTKYGPRTRIDLTDFLRGKVTLTKSGIRRSITFNPAGPVRGLLALSQDGTLMGAVRLVPNSIFRAIIETDEFGKITGNVRFVPKNLPFRAILHFETPRPRNWQFTGLTPGVDFVDLTARGAARGFTLQDFSFREVYGQLSQMQLRDVTFEAKIFKNTPFQLAPKLRIPIPDVKAILARLEEAGTVVRDGEGWTGVFSWHPTEAAKQEFNKVIASTDQSILGTISFSNLNTRVVKLIPEMRSRAYFEAGKFKEVLTSIRISGFNAIKDAKNLEIFSEIMNLPQEAWSVFKDTLNEVDARIILFMRRHGLASPADIPEFFETRYRKIQSGFEGIANRADIFMGTLNALQGVSDENVIALARKAHRVIPGGRRDRSWLSQLADIRPEDSAAIIERKLQDMVFFMRSLELDSPSISETLDRIDDSTIHLAATQFFRNK